MSDSPQSPRPGGASARTGKRVDLSTMLAPDYRRPAHVQRILTDLEAISDPHTRAVSAAAIAAGADAERERLRPHLYRAAVAARLTDRMPAVRVAELAGFNRQYLHRLTTRAGSRVPRVRAPSKQLEKHGARNQELIDLSEAAEEVRNTALEQLLTTPGAVGPPEGIPVAQLARDLQVTRQRLYQIRDQLEQTAS